MSVILNLETATTNCSVGISVNGEVVALKEHNTPNYSHSEQLHLFIEETLQDANLSIQDIDAIAVSKGPGSYTGLRIGVSAAKGLCFSLDVPLISIPTLESLAHSVNFENVDYVIPMLDARRMEVYAAVYDAKGKEVRETKAEVITADSFKKYVEKGKTLLVGTGVEKCQEILRHQNFSYEPLAIPSAKQMAVLSFEKFENGDFEDVAYFEPYYLKDFILQTKKQ